MGSVSNGQFFGGVLLALLLQIQPCYALDPRFELDLKALRAGTDRAKPEQAGTAAGKGASSADSTSLKRDSEARNGRVRKALKQKRTRRVDSVRKGADLAASRLRRKGQRHQAFNSARHGGRSEAVYTLSMHPSSGEPRDGVRWARQVWDRLLVSHGEEINPMQVEGKNFSLSLDPEKYPVFPAADGGRIVLDTERSLSPLVKAIIMEKDPKVRIVSENPADRRRFFASLFAAARFYSVEEGFSVSFGTDPKVTVTSDFKVEKAAESLSDSDIFLVNVTGKRFGIPDSLLAFLESEGFHMVESAPPPATRFPDGRRILCSISGGSRETVADALLKALSIDFERDRNLKLDEGSESGVNLTVRADLYHEDRGRRVVVSFAEANPIQHTLLRLLELKGYKVVMLYPEDDFRKVSQKLLSVFKIPAAYGMHHLWNPREVPFDVQLSGFIVGSGGLKDGTMLLTNVALAPLFKDLVGLNGYDVVER